MWRRTTLGSLWRRLWFRLWSMSDIRGSVLGLGPLRLGRPVQARDIVTGFDTGPLVAVPIKGTWPVWTG